MNILEVVSSKSNLELILCVLAVLVALRVITAVSFSAGCRAGRKAVFAAEAARWSAIDAEKEAFRALEEARKSKAEADARKREEGFGGRSVRRVARRTDRNNWMRSVEIEETLSWEHQENVEDRAARAAAAFEAALAAYNAAGEARNAADRALERLK